MGFVKMLLWGDDEVESALNGTATAEDHSAWGDETVEMGSSDLTDSLPIPGTDAREHSLRRTLEREAAEVRERDALAVRVGSLSLAIESLLRLLKDKGLITDLDLHRMELQVDQEDGLADGEFHPDEPPVPSHCPKCEARIPSGKRLCQLCGHSFLAEMSHDRIEA